MTLAEAIAQVETAQVNLGNADSAQAAANQKYQAALDAKTAADASDAEAVGSFNSALDALIAAATASKVDRTPVPKPPVT